MQRPQFWRIQKYAYSHLVSEKHTELHQHDTHRSIGWAGDAAEATRAEEWSAAFSASNVGRSLLTR